MDFLKLNQKNKTSHWILNYSKKNKYLHAQSYLDLIYILAFKNYKVIIDVYFNHFISNKLLSIFLIMLECQLIFEWT